DAPLSFPRSPSWPRAFTSSSDPPPSTPTVFPYTTLFRSIRIRNEMLAGVEGGYTLHQPDGEKLSIYDAAMRYQREGVPLVVIARSEEHTSELQSREKLVCRLLLEKKSPAARGTRSSA